jgi:Ca2+-binding RTX toxin-like protein
LGGSGNDTYIVDHLGDIVGEDLNGGNDRLETSVSTTFDMRSGNFIETWVATGNDAVGLASNPTAVFDETLIGNDAVNQLAGYRGNDTLTGGLGRDNFLFNTAINEASNVDTITDFTPVDDTMRLDNAVFTALANGKLPASQFALGAVALDGNDHVLYDPATGAVRYDNDGVGGASAKQFATLDPGLAVTAADFFVV